MNKNNSKVYYLLFFINILFLNPTAFSQELSDSLASKEAKTLYKNLYQLSKTHTIFGHQDDLAYGVNWKYEKRRSDIKDVVGDYPGIYGWDIGKIEHQSPLNIDKVPFNKMKKYIKQSYKRGGVITLSWHFDNPLTSGSSWDTTKNTVASILPGGVKHQLYITWLDNAAKFMGKLKGKHRTQIPILFRPFHEITGNWFWWGTDSSSPEEMKLIWRFTVDYLRNTKKLHNLIYVYNANNFGSEEEFLERYPGDDVVDVLSFDMYQFQLEDKLSFIQNVKNQAEILTKVGTEKNKMIAFAETGFEQIPDPTWWTQTLWEAIKDYPFSYVLVWRNAGFMPSINKSHYYGPYRGQTSSDDFIKFYQNEKTLFEKDLSQKNIYK